MRSSPLTLVDWRGLSADGGRHRPDGRDGRLDGRRVDPGARCRPLADPPFRPGRVRRSRSSGWPACWLVLRPDVPWLVGDRRPSASPGSGWASPTRRSRSSSCARPRRRTRAPSTSSLSLTDSLGTALGTGADRRDRRRERPHDGRPGARVSPSGFTVAIAIGLGGLALTGRLRPRTVPASAPRPVAGVATVVDGAGRLR